MKIIILTIILFGAAMLGLAVGRLFGGRSLKGHCGGRSDSGECCGTHGDTCCRDTENQPKNEP